MLSGDFPEVGRLMDTYWEQKKVLAPGCEPTSVKEIMAIIRPLCHGQLLVGAGGGGFMCVLTKEENAKELVEMTLKKYKVWSIKDHFDICCLRIRTSDINFYNFIIEYNI